MKRTAVILLGLLLAASLFCSAAASFLRARSAIAAPTEQAVAQGVVKGIDLTGPSLLLKHDTIAAFGMPAMTMAFPVREPRLLVNRTIGERVTFTLEKHGGDMSVVDLRSDR